MRWQLHAGVPLPALTIPHGKELISQCQRKKTLVNGQRTESVNTADEQTPLKCSEHLGTDCFRAEAEQTIAIAPHRGSRCVDVCLLVAVNKGSYCTG